MKPREPRYKVLIPARIRSPGGWQEACILNLSSRGAMVRASHSLERGDTIELRRGPHIIVARVMWNEGQRCGVMSQDAIAVDQFLDNPGQPPQRHGDRGEMIERRRTPRGRAEHADSARWMGRLIEYGVVAAIGAASAVVACAMVFHLLGHSLDAAGAALIVTGR